MSQAMVWFVCILFVFGIKAHAANAPDLQGLLRAMLFSYEAKVEQVTGIPSCEDELAQMIDQLGRLVAENSSDKHLGAVSEDAYNEEIRNYREERIASVGLSYEERVDRLRKMVPEPEPYRPIKMETAASRKAEFVFYLVTEFSKLEKSAVVNRAIRDLDDALSPNRRVRPMEIYYLPGDRGRAFRLMLFFRELVPRLDVDYEKGFRIFAEAFLTPEIIKESISAYQYENTQGLFIWLREHNPLIYLFFLEKYQRFTTEDFLLGRPA